MAHSAKISDPAADDASQTAARLLPLVYDELRRLARARMARVRSGQMLTPSELVHEAYLRVVSRKSAGFEGPGHLFFAVSRAMRDITVEADRSSACLKRGGNTLTVDCEEVEMTSQPRLEECLDLKRALDTLERHSPARARVVLLSYFGGLTHPEIAQVMGVSLATVERKWSHARTWLRQELSRRPASGPAAAPGLRNPAPKAAVDC